MINVEDVEDSVVNIATDEETAVNVATVDESAVNVATVDESAVNVETAEDSAVNVATAEDSAVNVETAEDSAVIVATAEHFFTINVEDNSSSSEDLPFCKYCQDTDEQDDMIQPCKCEGSSQHVHRTCLQKWMDSNVNKREWRCEICKERLEIEGKQVRTAMN